MEKKLTIPNILSCIRLVMVAAFVAAFFKISYAAAGVVALVASLTDVLDGYIARRFNMTSDFGRVIDPLADKLLQAAVCVCIGYAYELIVIPLIFLVKEFCMLLGGFIILRKGKNVPPSRWYGKLGTVSFFVCTLSVLFFCTPKNPIPAVILLLVAAGFMLGAFCGYVRVYFRINSSKKDSDTGFGSD